MSTAPQSDLFDFPGFAPPDERIVDAGELTLLDRETWTEMERNPRCWRSGDYVVHVVPQIDYPRCVHVSSAWYDPPTNRPARENLGAFRDDLDFAQARRACYDHSQRDRVTRTREAADAAMPRNSLGQIVSLLCVPEQIRKQQEPLWRAWCHEFPEEFWPSWIRQYSIKHRGWLG